MKTEETSTDTTIIPCGAIMTDNWGNRYEIVDGRSVKIEFSIISDFLNTLPDEGPYWKAALWNYADQFRSKQPLTP